MAATLQKGQTHLVFHLQQQGQEILRDHQIHVWPTLHFAVPMAHQALKKRTRQRPDRESENYFQALRKHLPQYKSCLSQPTRVHKGN